MSPHVAFEFRVGVLIAGLGVVAKALQNGKIMNKVLKLTGEVQAIQIKVCHITSE